MTQVRQVSSQREGLSLRRMPAKHGPIQPLSSRPAGVRERPRHVAVCTQIWPQSCSRAAAGRAAHGFLWREVPVATGARPWTSKQALPPLCSRAKAERDPSLGGSSAVTFLHVLGRRGAGVGPLREAPQFAWLCPSFSSCPDTCETRAPGRGTGRCSRGLQHKKQISAGSPQT